MLPDERRTLILTLLEGTEVLRPNDIAEQTGVSAETVRRDLVALEREGAVRRVYGGVARGQRLSRSSEPLRAEREGFQQRAKNEIGAVAASLVGEEDTLFMDVGTTVLAVARRLPDTFRGRILTNSITVAAAFTDRPGVDVHLAGGRLRHDELVVSGADTEAQVRKFYPDIAVIGSGGAHPVIGLTDYHVDEIAVRLAAVKNASRVYVLADSSKLGHVALRKVCDWDAVTAIITDSEADPELIAEFREAGTTVYAGRAPDPDEGGGQR
ncbi:DeoR family transcriptional regulator [Nocardiopsis ansamitocini]|uniref:DeoR family transcriptional regulator n=2 Tax=Nocardiopsis ansamitocini TaxID=1670832 RepID=A0A9W6P9W8_9ACTN|nr:DeoR family transcriptional regulator [Nocardiopsis ansamitocini]